MHSYIIFWCLFIRNDIIIVNTFTPSIKLQYSIAKKELRVQINIFHFPHCNIFIK